MGINGGTIDIELEVISVKKLVTVGASSYTGNYLLPRMLRDWEEANPDTEIKLEITDSEDVFHQVQDGLVEVGLIGACLESENVEAREFTQDDQLILIVPIGHDFADRGEIEIDELRGKDFILREPGSATRMWYREAFNRFKLTLEDLNAVAELDSHPAVITAVEAGLGLAMVPRHAADDALDARRVKEVRICELTPMTGSLYMIWPRADSLSPETRQFIDWLETERPGPSLRH